jgi:hypothetical protein
MKKLIILLLVMTMISCTSDTTQLRISTKEVRAKELSYSSITDQYSDLPMVRIIQVDTMFRAGDTLVKGTKVFRIIE